MLRGRRFERLHEGVWHLTEHEMTWDDLVTAAQLALPGRAYVTGITLIQRLGLDFGPRLPLHFVIEGDHHLELDRVFLHRTKRLAPTSGEGVVVAAAFLAYCATARVIDAIKVGDWLLHHQHASVAAIEALALAAPWRLGAAEALWVTPFLCAEARSLKESESRAVLCFAGLPQPEVNAALPVDRVDFQPIGDLYYPAYRSVVEYEGRQHHQDRRQYNSDVDRYALFRRAELRYVQVTAEKLRNPRQVATEVFRMLVEAGYDGPSPEFGDRWSHLFTPLSGLVGSRRDYLRDLASHRAVS